MPVIRAWQFVFHWSILQCWPFQCTAHWALMLLPVLQTPLGLFLLCCCSWDRFPVQNKSQATIIAAQSSLSSVCGCQNVTVVLSLQFPSGSLQDLAHHSSRLVDDILYLSGMRGKSRTSQLDSIQVILHKPDQKNRIDNRLIVQVASDLDNDSIVSRKLSSACFLYKF